MAKMALGESRAINETSVQLKIKILFIIENKN
jgi:hypothetical protein